MASYTVTFNLNDGYRTGGGALVQTVESGGYAVAPTCEREGCVFRQWDSLLGPITSDKEITAIWIEFTTLYYSADGATNVPPTVERIEAGSTVYVSEIRPGKLTNLTYDANGNTFVNPDSSATPHLKTVSLQANFLGWHSDGERASEGLVEYYPGDPITMWGNVTLYAVFGTTTVAELPVVGAGSYPMTSDTAYQLDAWTTTRNGSTVVTVGSQVTANSTIYARWKKIVTFNATSGKIVENGTAVTTTTRSYAGNISSFTIPSFTMQGVNNAEFLGWSTSASATTAQYQPGASVPMSSSMTIYAVWKLATFTVTWISEGTVIRTDRNVPYGASLTPPTVTSTETTRKLVGWSGDYTNVTSDMELVALWDTIVVWYRSSAGKWIPYKPKEGE